MWDLSAQTLPVCHPECVQRVLEQEHTGELATRDMRIRKRHIVGMGDCVCRQDDNACYLSVSSVNVHVCVSEVNHERKHL